MSRASSLVPFFPADIDEGVLHFPPEVVGRILRDHILEEEAIWYTIARRRKVASAVSPTWRNVVYSTSAYWRYVPVHRYLKPSWVAFAVEKAKNGPLVVEINVQSWALPYPGHRQRFRRERCMTLSRFLTMSLPLLRDVYHRVVSIILYADTDSDAVAVLGVLAHYNGSSIRHATVFSHSTSIPAGAFSTDVQPMPQLSRMLLRHTRPMALGISLLPSLHTLQIAAISARANVTQESLLNVLKNCTGLKELELNNVVCVGEYDGPPVFMPGVSRFRMDHFQDSDVQVIKWVRMPFLQELCVVSVIKVGYLRSLLTDASHIFADAVSIDLRCREIRLRTLEHAIRMMRNARVLDLRCSTFVPDLVGVKSNLNRAFQSTRLHTIRLPPHVPFDVLHSMLEYVNSGMVGVTIQVEVRGGDSDNVRWTVVDNALVKTPVRAEVDSRWMSAFSASLSEYRSR